METLQGWEAEAMLERTIGEDAEGTFVLCWPLLTPRDNPCPPQRFLC